MGLGSFESGSLGETRKKAAWTREQVRNDSDPIKQRRLKIQQSNLIDGRLEPLAWAVYEAYKVCLKHNGPDGKWFSPLRLRVLPKVGKMPLVKIDQDDIAYALAPIWHKKSVTAKKAVSSLRSVFRYARVKGFLVNRAVIEDAAIILGENKKRKTPH